MQIERHRSHIAPSPLVRTRPPVHSFQQNPQKKCVSISEVAKSSVLVDFFAVDKVDTVPVESAAQQEALPEDVEVTAISMPSFRTMSDHILYQCDVINEHKRRTFQKWTILKRYGQFYDMDCAVREALQFKPAALAEMPPFPPRKAKLLLDHMDQVWHTYFI